MLQLRKTKKVFANFPRGFWRFPTKFQRFANSAVLEPRTGQFSRTLGFVAKAKDFKMCPRGLHLWLRIRLALQQENHAKLDNDFREYFERKEGEKVLAKCKSCKFAATPAPNKTGKSYFHSGNLMQHLKRKHPRTA